MQKHLEEVLTATGLPADQVKALVELPEDTKDFKTDAYVAPIHTAIEGKVKNDPKFYEGINKENLPKEFLQKLTAENYGAAAATVRHHMMKAVGLTEKEFADLGEDMKKMEIFTPAFVKKISEGKIGDKELQAKLMDANAEIEKLNTGLPEIEKKYKTEYETKISDFQFSAGVLGHLASVKDLTAPAKYLAGDITQQLRAKYGFEIVGNAIELRQKEKPTLKVLTDNGTKELTLAGAIDQILAAENLVAKKSTKTETITTHVNTGEGGLKISKNVSDKINKRKAEDEKISAAS